MANELGDFGRRLESLVDGPVMQRMAAKGGAAGKRVALEAVSKDLGSDRAFSGMRRRTGLSAGYDNQGGGVVAINFRPAGLWKLAEDGRNKSGKIKPRARGGKKAVMTPRGPRRSSTYGPSRGLGTFTDAVHDAQREVPKAAHEQFVAEIRRVVR